MKMVVQRNMSMNNYEQLKTKWDKEVDRWCGKWIVLTKYEIWMTHQYNSWKYVAETIYVIIVITRKPMMDKSIQMYHSEQILN